MTVYYLISVPTTDVGMAEVNSGHQALKRLGRWPSRVIKAQRLDDIALQPGDVFWIHAASENLASDLQKPDFYDRILTAVEHGAGLLLTLNAVTLPHLLGIEPVKPQVIESARWRKETGHYAYRGFIGFDEHPLFNVHHRFRTRTHTWTPQDGEPYWSAVYRGETPERVIARGARYLSAVDDDAAIWEYFIGEGRILCVGANLYFNARRNYERPQALAFLHNCIEYLSHKHEPPVKRCYWPKPEKGMVRAASIEELSLPPVEITFSPEKYFERPGVPSLPGTPGHRFYACAGRRILLMGRQGENIGEVWSYPVRLFKNIHWSILPDGKGNLPQKGLFRSCDIFPDAVHQIYEYASWGVREQIGTNIFKPASYLNLEIIAERAFIFELKFRCDLALMWPMPEGAGGKLFVADADDGVGVRSTHKGLWAWFGISKKPAEVKIDDVSGAASEVEVTLRFPLMKPGMHYLDFAMVGGTDRLDVPRYDAALVLKPSLDIDRSADHYRNLHRTMLQVECPDAEINEGVRWAQLKMEAFRAVTPGIGRGLTAGLAISGSDWLATRPGYGWYFGRDSLWTSLALLTVGQWNAVLDSLRLLADFVAFDGKIFHELSPSNYPHYDSADANPLFLITAERYLAWTGDDRTIRQIEPALKKALHFSFNADRDGDGLTENTGVGHGWIEAGKLAGAHVTFYLAGLWLRALESALVLFRNDPDQKLLEKIQTTAETVRELMRTRFWDEDHQTYYYALLADGTMQPADTIMAAPVILFGDTDAELDRHFLIRSAGPDIVADWGARMISELDGRYNPTGYHIGSVWPLYTGWLGLAQYARDRDLQGYTLLRAGMATYRDFSTGCFSEVLRGDSYDEIGVCPQQAWSAGLLLWLLTKGMLGLRPDSAGVIRLSPALPGHWRQAAFRNIRWTDGTVDLIYRREGPVITFVISGMKRGDRLNFAPRFVPGSWISSVAVDGVAVEPYVHDEGGRPCLDMPIFGPGKDVEIVVTLERYIALDVEMPPPVPGQPSRGYRVTDYRIDDAGIGIDLAGPQGSRAAIAVVDPGDLLAIPDYERADGERKIVEFIFPLAQGPYGNQILRWPFKPGKRGL